VLLAKIAIAEAAANNFVGRVHRFGFIC
jgi:hypothetical protein